MAEFYFARYARCGPPALVGMGTVFDRFSRPFVEWFILIPAPNPVTLAQRIHWFSQVREEQTEVCESHLIVLAKMQALSALAAEVPAAGPPVTLEQASEEELGRWQLLGHFVSLGDMRQHVNGALAAAVSRLGSVAPLKVDTITVP